VQSILQTVFKPLLDERERWVLWLPVFMGLGVALYFSGHAEPELWPAALAFGVLLIGTILARNTVFLPALLVALMVALGFCAAKLETIHMQQPVLKAPAEKRLVEGRVIGVDRLPEGYRLLLTEMLVDGLAKEETPRTARIKFPYGKKLPRVGAWISMTATLYPLSGPIEPGAFNFRRFAFYQGYGATGFAIGYWHYEKGPRPSFLQKAGIFFEKLRNTIGEKLRANDASRETAVAVALITGDQAAIPKGTLTSMRVSGISHILSVSGLHIAMVAGAVFFVLRALMALWPWMALHWPIKKIAAGFAMAAAVFYTLMCAAPVPAVRSMLMTGLVLLAVMVDRRALSMRLVAFAAFICLLFSPAALLDVSFQLSFGAVIALVAAFEKQENALFRRFMDESWWGKIGFYVVGSILTSLIASAATMPFILYYFQQVNWYGVLTNLVAVPLSSFIIMPAAVAAVLMMPFGLEEGPLWVMREGIRVMLKSADAVSMFPGAVTYHPAMGFGFLLLVALGGLWLCLWRRNWRWIGLVPVVVGTLGFLATPRPDLRVADDGITLALRVGDQTIVRAKALDEFEVDVWRQRDGLNRPKPLNWFNVADGGGKGAFKCVEYDCIYAWQDTRFVFPMSDEAIAAACSEGDVIIGRLAESACPGKIVINREVTARKGSHAFYFSDEGLKIKTAMDGKNRRPWE
jgi:competence protein ComEC